MSIYIALVESLCGTFYSDISLCSDCREINAEKKTLPKFLIIKYGRVKKRKAHGWLFYIVFALVPVSAACCTLGPSDGHS